MVSIYFKNNEKNFLEKILNNTKKNKKQKAILIVPEQYSFYAEKFIYKNIKMNSYINNLEVFSFKKLCFKIFKNFGYIAGDFATKQTKIIALAVTILKLEKEFKIQENMIGNFPIEKILNSIEELKKNNISKHILKEKINKIKDNNLKIKTKNFFKILNLYEKILEKSFKDPTKNIEKAIEFSIENKIFKNVNIYFLFFFKFNILELNLIEIMMQQGNLKFLIPFEKKQPLFKITKNTIEKIIEIAKKNNIKIIEQKLKIKTDNNIEKNIFRQNKKIRKIKQKNKIKIYIEKNKKTEIENALKKTVFLNRKGIEWHEIAILSQNIEHYKTELKTSIKNFNIPCFFNDNSNANDMILINIIKNILEISISFDIKIFLTILKSNLTKFTTREISNFENRTIYFKNNKTKISNEDDIETIKDYEKINKKLKKMLDSFKKCNNSSEDISIMLLENLKILGIKNKIENSNELENLKKEWEILVEILENIYILTKNITINKKQFKFLFNSACKETKIKKIPQNKNCVIISNIKKETPKDKKAIIFLTSNEEFPLKHSHSNEFFTDEEIKNLNKLNLKFLLTSDEKNLIETFLTYKAFSSSLKYNYIFYTSKGQKQDRYNEVIEELARIYGEDIIEKIDEKNYINSCITNKIAFKKLLMHYKEKTKEITGLKKYFEKQIKILEKNNKTINHKIDIKKYFDNKLSPTQIEQFHLCQFSYFCKHILKIQQNNKKENENKKIFGNITHKILEKIVSLKNFLNLSDEEISKQIINNLNKIVTSNLILKQNNSKYEISRYYELKKDLEKICLNIQNELKILNFKPIFFEYRISDFTKIKPLKIKIDDEISISVNGIIDRIDIKKTENKKILRIVDYKYNKKSLNFKDLLDGLNLQIILYLITLEKYILKLDNVEILGVFYLTTIGALKKYETFKKTPQMEEIKNFKEKLKPTAILIESQETNKIIEKIKSDSYKEYSPIKTTKENIIYRKDEEKTIISKDELKIFYTLIENKIKKMFYSIKNLKFCKNPIKLPQTKILYCTYCDFKEICKEEEILEQQNSKNLNKVEFLQYVEQKNKEQKN